MKFIVDEMLGKLAKWLRLLGYDTSYITSIDDGTLVQLAFREKRIIITRDTHMLERKHLPRYLFIKSDNYLEQVKQTFEELNLTINFNMFFTRCLLCNSMLCSITKEMVKGSVPEYTYQTHEEFFNCPQCDKIYWSGTHREKIYENLKKIGLISN